MSKILLALYNMGGPNSTSEVDPFLTALFRDNDLLGVPFPSLLQERVADAIVRKRLKEVTERYELLGGKSPQLGITLEVASRLKNALMAYDDSREFIDVVPLMRYTQPDVANLIERSKQSNVDEVWLLSQYPHCSRATTGSFLRELGLKLRSHNARLSVRSFLPFSSDPAFASLWRKRIQNGWNLFAHERRHLLVSAHSIPKSYAAEGDPYATQIERFAIDVLLPLGLVQGRDWSLAWQSAVGPAKWFGPSVPDALQSLRAKGIENVLLWPISFVSDHIETLFEIDIDFKEQAQRLGFRHFERLANLNAESDYIEYLTKLVTTEHQKTMQDKNKTTSHLYSLESSKLGPACHLQPGGCLCKRYFNAGAAGKPSGTPAAGAR